jgi:hypothetical protein
MNRDVTQAFQPAGSGDFPVPSLGNTGQECPVNPQTGMSALPKRRGSWKEGQGEGGRKTQISIPGLSLPSGADSCRLPREKMVWLGRLVSPQPLDRTVGWPSLHPDA